MTKIVDPPAGWLFGFPSPLQENYEVQLREAGYPEKDIPFALKHSRYWETELKMEIEQLEMDLRSMTPMEMVKEYSQVSGQTPDPSLYSRLIEEEYEEFKGAYCFEPDESLLKEMADLVYVVYGYANARGWDLDMALLRVHDNNMGRMYQPDGTILRREDGKVIKNKDYPKVALGDLV